MSEDRRPEIDEGRLLALLEELVRELHPRRAKRIRVGLDSSLERDLGLDSLTRMELLDRLEEELGVQVSETALVGAETPRDVLAALGEGSTAAEGRAPAAREYDAGDEAAAAAPADVAGEVDVPQTAATLVEVMEHHAERHGDRRHILFHPEQGAPEELTYAGLLARARRAAAGLARLGIGHGDAVGLMLPSGLDYFAAFAGTLVAGAVPVPLYPPVRRSQVEDHLRRQAGILDTARVKVLITFPEVLPLARLLTAQVDTLERTATVPDLEADDGAPTARPATSGDDVAFLQFTSGSTGSPKGVVLTHANLLANLRSMVEALGITGEDDVVVSWLPLYHDMGLIGAWMGSLYLGMPLVLMSPLSFLARPARWLRAIERHGGTISAAPNFAYELCLKKISEEECEGLDLSSWRLALNGAEPVSPDTLERFVDRFSAYGFRRRAMTPVYGLAENSLGVSFPPVDRGPRVATIRRGPFSRDGWAEPAEENDADVLRFVGVGHPIPRHEVRIVDSAGNELDERREGRLQFRGPSATSGYYRNPEATRELVDGEWRDSGDMAFVAEGEIFITGRAKDIIIRGGRNIYPQELEEAVGEVPGVRKGCVAVFGSLEESSGTERLVVLAETREEGGEERDAIEDGVQRLAVDLLGLPADEVLLAPPHTVPKTSSGKIRRSAARELYERGEVGRGPRAVWWQVARLGASAALGRLRAARRSFGRLLFAGWAWTAFGMLAAPVWLGAVALPGERLRRRWVRGGARWLARLTATPLAARGLEHLEGLGPSVLVANHTSYLDVFALTAVLPPRFVWVAKSELAGNPLAAWPLRRLGTLFVERFDVSRSVDDARHAGEALAEGRSLAFFPEGTFRRAPGLGAFRMGAFVLAAEAGVPVVPVGIRGARPILPAESWRPRPGRVTVEVAEPIEPAGDDWSAALAVRDAAREAIAERCREPDLER